VSPRHLAALELDTKQNTPIYSLRSVFHARFLAIANHRLLQHPPVVSARHHFGLMPEPDQRFDYLNQTAGAAPPWPGTCHGRGRTSAGRPGYDIGESGGVSPHPLSSGCLCHARNASYIRFALQPKCRAKNRQQDRETRSNPTDLLSTKPLPLATVDSNYNNNGSACSPFTSSKETCWTIWATPIDATNNEEAHVAVDPPGSTGTTSLRFGFSHLQKERKAPVEQAPQGLLSQLEVSQEN